MRASPRLSPPSLVLLLLLAGSALSDSSGSSTVLGRRSRGNSDDPADVSGEDADKPQDGEEENANHRTQMEIVKHKKESQKLQNELKVLTEKIAAVKKKLETPKKETFNHKSMKDVEKAVAIAVADTMKSQEPSMDLSAMADSIAKADMRGLEAAMDKAEAAGLDPDRLAEGAAALALQSQGEDIREAVELLSAKSPIITQRAYTTYVNRLSRLIKRAEMDAAGGDMAFLDGPKAVVQKAHSEYWLKMASMKFDGVDIATEELLPYVDKLASALGKCNANAGGEELRKESETLLFRLRAEIELAAALEAIPADDTIKLPLPEYETAKAEVAYWADTAEQDNGRFDDSTEGFPLPPQVPGDEEGVLVDGEYVWIKSKTLQLLQSTNDRLQTGMDAGVTGGANEGLCEAAKVKLAEVAGKLKLLNAKDEADKAKDLEKVEKDAKKLRKKKGKK